MHLGELVRAQDRLMLRLVKFLHGGNQELRGICWHILLLRETELFCNLIQIKHMIGFHNKYYDHDLNAKFSINN
jgi:hypothetical protein